ncbi:hypothetical protein TNCV_133471 [Trichonephila clavipes]|nr:hypothetical protein TNCV_133471 [Trichonephila clavipes]
MYKNALKEDFIRVVEKLDGTVESTDTIVKLKTKIENSSTFESDPDFVKTLIQNCIDERVSQNEREVTSEQKIELAKLQLAKLEKEIELQLAKNKALSLNPAAKVEEKQFETNIENMIKNLSVGTAISPTLTEEFIIHPSVYSEIEKLGHAKSDVLLSESESSLGAHAYAYSSAISFPNVSVSNSPLVSMEIPLRTAYSQAGRCGMQPKAKHKSSRAGAAKTRTETCEIVEKKQKLLDIKKRRTREVREQALPSEYHRQTYL